MCESEGEVCEYDCEGEIECKYGCWRKCECECECECKSWCVGVLVLESGGLRKKKDEYSRKKEGFLKEAMAQTVWLCRCS